MSYMVVCLWQMPRASETQKAERLNRARDLLLHVDQLSDAVEQLARDCSISPRQAYRYLEQAQRLKQPVPPSEAKLAFTVKLPNSLIRLVRAFAAVKRIVHQRGGQPSVARAAAARARAWVSRNQFGHAPCSWNMDSIVCCRTNSRTCTICSCRIDISQSEEKLRNRRIQPRE